MIDSNNLTTVELNLYPTFDENNGAVFRVILSFRCVLYLNVGGKTRVQMSKVENTMQGQMCNITF